MIKLAKQNLRKRGGTMFPRYSLKDILQDLGRFVSKTHSDTIDLAQLNSGVFSLKANSGAGKIRLSAMRQFGLVDGVNAKLKASVLARNISNKSGDEKVLHIQKSFLNPKSFGKTFSTFSGDSVTLDKISQYAVDPIRVHPDNGGAFASVFAKSAEACNLGKIEGDSLTLFKNESTSEEVVLVKPSHAKDKIKKEKLFKTESQAKANIEIKLDSTHDAEKLKKQLELLKEYGLI